LPGLDSAASLHVRAKEQAGTPTELRLFARRSRLQGRLARVRATACGAERWDAKKQADENDTVT